MAKQRSLVAFSFSAGGALLLLAGCEANSGSSGTSGTTAQLESAAEDISTTVGSREEAHAQIKACFETFRSCAEAAADDDTTSCRDALKACLPARPPMPPWCDDESDDDAGATAGEPASDAGPAPAASALDKHRGGDDDDAADSDDDDDDATVGDGGTVSEDDDHEGGHHRRRHGRHHGRHCERPEVPRDHFAHCGDQTGADLEGGMDAEHASSGHQACVHGAFADRIESLCKKASELCARPDASQAICDKISAACASAQTDADAGAPSD